MEVRTRVLGSRGEDALADLRDPVPDVLVDLGVGYLG
jgi:hypothetical protein